MKAIFCLALFLATFILSAQACSSTSCGFGQVCLTCGGGNSGCFPSSHSGYTCCGCDGVLCYDCPSYQSCRTSSFGTYTCVSSSTPYSITITGPGAGAIVGIVIGSIVFFVALLVGIICCVRRRNMYTTVDVVSPAYSTYNPSPVIVSAPPVYVDHHHHHGHHHHAGVGFQAGGGGGHHFSAGVGYQSGGSNAGVGFQTS